ncbi:MAG: DUF1674 domain-containing protein [Steroidobacteraceae bacterium]
MERNDEPPARLPAEPSAMPAGANAGVSGGAPAGTPAGAPVKEIGGREGPEPTRFGDWELRGRCIDF